MKLKIRLFMGSVASAVFLLSAPFSGAQQAQAPIAKTSFSYDSSRETTIQGTVVSYTAVSLSAPIGPHATIRTASGTVDVHLGNASLIKSNGMNLTSGDSVKISGVLQTFGTQSVFLARVLQKGNQVLTLRNAKGMPLLPARTGAVKTRSILEGAK
ncbi:MAG: hypothetical protein WBE12_09970 [Candidatus Acidiferrum sp.]